MKKTIHRLTAGLARSIIAVVALTAFSSPATFSQTFQKLYQPTDGANAWGYCVQQTSDGGFIVAGRADVNNWSAYRNALLIKTNSSGGITWANQYDYNRTSDQKLYDEARYVIEVDDFPMDGQTDGFVFVGWTNDLITDPLAPGGYSASDQDILVTKTDLNGNVIWMSTYGDPNNDHDEKAFCVKQNPNNGNYVLTGVAEVDPLPTRPSDSRMFVMEVHQATGAIQWDELYGQTTPIGSPETGGYSLDYHDFNGDGTDDGWIVAGWTTHNPTVNHVSNRDVYLAAITWTGNVNSLRRVRVHVGTSTPPFAHSDEIALSVQQISTGDVVVSGEYAAPASGPGSSDQSGLMLLSVTGNLGAVNWMRTYTGWSSAMIAGHSVREFPFGLVVASGGSMMSAIPADADPTPMIADNMLLATTLNGATAWFAQNYRPSPSSTYNGSAHSVRVLPNADFVTTGVDQAFGSQQSVHLAHTDRLGHTDCDHDDVEVTIETLFPNIVDHGSKQSIAFEEEERTEILDDDLEGDDVCAPKRVIRQGKVLPENGIGAYPSPLHSGDALTLTLDPSSSTDDIGLIVSDMLGNTVREEAYDFPSTDGVLTISTEGLNAGTYTVTVAAGEEVYSRKIVILE